MRILITAGPTREPLDAVRYIGNRSSGRMGAAIAAASLKAGHQTTAIFGPVSISIPSGLQRIDVETAEQMLQAVVREFPSFDLLIMTAAVSDFRPKNAAGSKLHRAGGLTLELEATQDVIAHAGSMKRADQRTVGFSLESEADLGRARQKLLEKKLDLIIYNPTETINSERIEPTLLYPDGRSEKLPSRPKSEFADILIQRSTALFKSGGQ